MKRLLSLLLTFALVLSFVPFAAASDFERITELRDLILEYSLDYKDGESDPLLDAIASLMEKDPELFGRIAEEMMSKLDSYSGYMTEEDYAVAFPSGSAYVGVGIVVDYRYPYGVVVDSLVTGGAAYDAGVLPGDVIVSVDGEDIEFLPYSEAVPMIRGEPGTVVTLEVRRQGKAALLKFELARRHLSVPNVTYENMGNGVGLITISRFESIADFFAFSDIYSGIPYGGDVKSVIIDLRGNPGGDLSVMFNMLNHIIRDRNIPILELVNSSEEEIFFSSGAGVWTPNRLLILVDEYSASAAEIFAGSLQTLGLAEVVGQTTYGKGRSQYHFRLDDESVAIITAYEVLLPYGRAYDGVGITPDYEVEQGEGPYQLSKLPALNAARDLKQTSLYSAQTLALQQRLKALGIFPGVPNGRFDRLTAWSVNVFQKIMEMPVLPYADKATQEAVNAEIEALRRSVTVVDTQMEYALELAEEAAKLPWSREPDEPWE